MGYERQLMGDDGLNAAEILYETIDEETGERALPAPTAAALKAATIDKVDAKMIDIDEHLAGASLELGEAVAQKFGEVDDKLDDVEQERADTQNVREQTEASRLQLQDEAAALLAAGPQVAADRVAVALDVASVKGIAKQLPAADPDALAWPGLPFANETGDILAYLDLLGTFLARGYKVLDAAGNAVTIGADAGAITLPSVNIGGIKIETRDIPGYKAVVVDSAGGILAQLLDEPQASTSEVLAQMRMVNAAKNRVTSRRLGTVCFIFDDLQVSDETMMVEAEKLGIVLGFAINCERLNADNAVLYQRAYARGHVILSHSTDAAGMSAAPANQVAIDAVEAKLRNSKKILEGYGFKVSGFVTPNSDLNPAYIDIVRRYYGYAFTRSSALGWDAAIDPTLLARQGIETLLDVDNATYGGHNLGAVTAKITEAATNKWLVAFYCHLVSATYHPGEYYNNADLTPRPSVNEMVSIFQTAAAMRDAGQILLASPDEALATFYRTPFA